MARSFAEEDDHCESFFVTEIANLKMNSVMNNNIIIIIIVGQTTQLLTLSTISIQYLLYLIVYKLGFQELYARMQNSIIWL